MLATDGQDARPLPQAGLAWRPSSTRPAARRSTGPATLEPTRRWSRLADRRRAPRRSVAGAAGRTPRGGRPPTPPTGDQTEERAETTIAEGPLADWDARWDETGTRLAVWIADADDPTVGTLSLYVVDPFDGRIDLASPPLEDEPALAGFSIADGRLAWAAPRWQFGQGRARADPRLDERRIRPGRDRRGRLPARSLRRLRPAPSRGTGDAGGPESAYRARIVRPSRLLAIAALTAALALVVLPDIAGSRSPSSATIVDPAAFQPIQVPASAGEHPTSVGPLDPSLASAGRVNARHGFVEPGQAPERVVGRPTVQQPAANGGSTLRSRRATSSPATRRSTPTGRRRCGCRAGRR